MYPSGELAKLARRKEALQVRIAARRRDCVDAAAELSRPLSQIDRGIEIWHRFAPYLKLLMLPAGLVMTGLAARRSSRRGGYTSHKKSRIAALLAAMPLIFRGVKMAMAFREAYANRAATGNVRAKRPA